MNLISLRNLPPEVARIIQQRAREQGISLNKAVIRLLEEALGVEKRPERRYDDLDWLAGAWSKKEAEELEKGIAAQRQIDPRVWK